MATKNKAYAHACALIYQRIHDERQAFSLQGRVKKIITQAIKDSDYATLDYFESKLGVNCSRARWAIDKKRGIL